MVIERFCILLVLIVGAGASAQYREIPLPYPDTTRFKVQFIDEMHGWVSSRNGSILQTKDGGASWQEHIFNGSPILEYIQFVDKESGWILVDECNGDMDCIWLKLYRTTNGGRSWERAPFPDSTGIIRRIYNDLNIEYLDKNTIVFDGYRQITSNQAKTYLFFIFETRDAGAVWDSIATQVTADYYHAFFARNNSHWLMIYSQTDLIDIPSQIACFLTNDTGRSWRGTQGWSDVIGRNIWKSDANRILIFNDKHHRRGDYTLGTFLTTDGGESWDTIGYFNIAKMAVMPADTELWVIDLGVQTLSGKGEEMNIGKLYRLTTSSTLTKPWDSVLMYPEKVRWISYSGSNMYALTSDGRLFVYDDSPVLVEEPAPVNDLPFLRIQAIYPQPCRSHLTITFVTQRTQQISLFVYNVMGERVIDMSLPGKALPGRHVLDVKTANLHDGMYLIALSTSNGTSRMKFLKYR